MINWPNSKKNVLKQSFLLVSHESYNFDKFYYYKKGAELWMQKKCDLTFTVALRDTLQMKFFKIDLTHKKRSSNGLINHCCQAKKIKKLSYVQ